MTVNILQVVFSRYYVSAVKYSVDNIHIHLTVKHTYPFNKISRKVFQQFSQEIQKSFLLIIL